MRGNNRGRKMWVELGGRFIKIEEQFSKQKHKIKIIKK
jgi:hypothetical protein